AQLGLPLPRLALRRSRRGAERSGSDGPAAARARHAAVTSAQRANRPVRRRAAPAMRSGAQSPRGRSLSMIAAAALLGGCAHEPVQIVSNDALAAAVASLEIPSDAAVLVGTGDIADCDQLDGARATGALVRFVLERAPDALVFTTGDHAYPDGTPEEFAD